MLLPQGQLGAKLHLIGGRGIGIFIHSERKNSEDGLHSGDQLTMVTITIAIGGNANAMYKQEEHSIFYRMAGNLAGNLIWWIGGFVSDPPN